MLTAQRTYAVTACLLLAAAVAPAIGAETIHFREGGGSGYTDVTFDDTRIFYNPADDTTHGNEDFDGIQCSSSEVSLIAIKDLFTELPTTSGGNAIVITSATLHLFRYNQGTSSITISVYPVTTNWLPDPAGSNENDVSGEHAEKSGDTHWASGDFSSSDYDGAVVDTGSWVDGYNEECELDITNVIAEIYADEVNYGIVLFADGSLSGRASENATSKPSLEMIYDYSGVTYTLTVNSGTGDGDYAENQIVDISADTPPSGQGFDEWVGDTSGIADTSDPTTTITMPASNTEITATYTDATLYTLTVNSGTGDGSYEEGWEVGITADTAPSGQQFEEWMGDTSGIADVNAASTTLTMPASNAEVTATYTDITDPYITGVSGSVIHGQSIAISGGNFGSKPTAAPLKWETFEDGVDGTNVTTTGYWSSETDFSRDHTLFDDEDDISTRHTHSDLHVRWEGINVDPDCTRSFYRDDVGFSATGKAYVNLWVYLDLEDGTGGGTGWQFKLFRIKEDVDHDARPGFTCNPYTNDDETITYWPITVASSVSIWGPTGSRKEGYWINMAMEYKDSTALNEPDGEGHFYVSCTPLSSGTIWKGSQTGVTTRDDSDQGWVDNFAAGYLLVNDAWHAKTYWDDIYLDKYWARVEIGDASTYANCKHREVQVPSAWSGSSIAATVNQGSLPTGTAYLFVVDPDGTVSPGYEVTISSGTTYTLTVNSGTGDGSYAESAVADIDADTAPSGQEFDQWVGDTSGIASVTTADTTLTMPAANQEITATYQALTLYTLTVNSGTGDGSYAASAVADIDADTAPSGYAFDEWVGDTSGIASVTNASTTLTMPAANQEVTATYTDTGPIDDVATGETPVKGTVSGDYTDTHTSNDVYESITERESTGKPSSRYSYLEHKWTFNVTGGSTVTFYVEAYKTDNTENDDFVFAYCTNGEDWTNMVTVTKISDDDNTQSYALPSSLSGTTYVRVKDTDQTQGNKSLDTIYVDHMFIRNE